MFINSHHVTYISHIYVHARHVNFETEMPFLLAVIHRCSIIVDLFPENHINVCLSGLVKKNLEISQII